MPRRLRVETAEMGFLELYLIYQYGAVWEPAWEPLAGHPLASVFTVVSKETMDHALHGFSRPLVQQLGLPPQGCLHKLPQAHRVCGLREGCVFYSKTDCHTTSKKLPNCFQPDGVEGDTAQQLGHDVVRLWREGVYIVVVQE